VSLLELNGLSKSYGRFALEEVRLGLDRGEVLCLLGPSGCGKTTLLRLVAGLEAPDKGRVFFDGLDVTDLPPQKRSFGLMFQEYALFPHKNVFDNVAFGLRMKKWSGEETRRRTGRMLDLVGISGLAKRDVASLSGGERQRVALARSLAPQPRLLMLDEPLGSLDRALRERLLPEIRAILKNLETTAIFVTHDQSEALAVADKIAVMSRGRLVQVAGPEELYLHPKTEFVARFLGFQNLLPGRVTAGGGVETRLGVFHPPGLEALEGEEVTLVLRPEGGRLAGPDQAPGPSPLISGRVAGRLFTGQSFRVRVALDELVDGGEELVFDLANETPPPDLGRPISLTLGPAGLVVVDRNGKQG